MTLFREFRREEALFYGHNLTAYSYYSTNLVFTGDASIKKSTLFVANLPLFLFCALVLVSHTSVSQSLSLSLGFVQNKEFGTFERQTETGGAFEARVIPRENARETRIYMISSSKKQQQQQPPHHPTTTTTTTTTTNASKNSYFRFTKTDLETTERELLLQCEETKRGNEINAIRAVVAGGEREAIRSALFVGGFGDVVGRTTAERRVRRDDGDDDGGGGKGNEEDDEESFLAREGRMVLKMARQKENMDQFTSSRTTTTTTRREEEEEEEENEIEKREERTEKLTEMNTESAKRTFELESRGWETEETVVAAEAEATATAREKRERRKRWKSDEQCSRKKKTEEKKK